jgi:AcrR family transcriptional regulator
MPSGNGRRDDQMKGSVTAARPDTMDRIVTAAYICFDKIGISKTTIEDIAAAAKVSRPTVYRHFASKTDIIQHISMLETLKLNSEIRRRSVHHDDPIDTIVEAMVITARVAIKNDYVRRVMESISVPAISMHPAGPVHRLTRESWRPLIDEGRRRGQFANDLDIDQIVSWLSLSQAILLLKIDATDIGDPELRIFVRRFLVEPLLAGHGASLNSAQTS